MLNNEKSHIDDHSVLNNMLNLIAETAIIIGSEGNDTTLPVMAGFVQCFAIN